MRASRRLSKSMSTPDRSFHLAPMRRAVAISGPLTLDRESGSGVCACIGTVARNQQLHRVVHSVGSARQSRPLNLSQRSTAVAASFNKGW